MIRPRSALLLLGACALAWACAPDGAASAAATDDRGARADAPLPVPAAIVLVVVDTLRADVVSCLGHELETTRHLDRLAAQGTLFTQAYAPSSWTVPSMASLHTALHPSAHGVVSGSLRADQSGAPVRQQVLGDSFTTLAETLAATGYSTVGVAANRHLAGKLGFGQGFDVYYDEARFMPAKALNEVIGTHLGRAFGKRWATTWIDRRPFVWLHYFDPHDPYTARLPWARAFADDYIEHPWLYPADLSLTDLHERHTVPDAAYRDCALPLYEAEVAYWDDRFARLARELGAARDDVLLVITSDHGEEFAEHGGLGHSRTLYEELVRIPLVFHWPRGLPAGRRIDAPVSLLDLYPTLVELAGGVPPPGLDGRSLAGVLRGTEPADEARPLFFELHEPKPALRAVRHGRWKLIRGRGPQTAVVELYDLTADPAERINLAQEQPAIVARLGAELDRFVADLPEAPRPETLDVLDPHLAERLRSLGYLGDEADAGVD